MGGSLSRESGTREVKGKCEAVYNVSIARNNTQSSAESTCEPAAACSDVRPEFEPAQAGFPPTHLTTARRFELHTQRRLALRRFIRLIDDKLNRQSVGRQYDICMSCLGVAARRRDTISET